MSVFAKRLYVAYLIDSGSHNVPTLMEATGMHRRTVQSVIDSLKEMGIDCVFEGANKDGTYRIRDWGAINRDWVYNNLQHIKNVL